MHRSSRVYVIGTGAAVAVLVSMAASVRPAGTMPPVRVEENLAESNQCDLSSAVNSTQVAETETTSHLFREGGVTALKSEWIVAGVEEDSRGGLLNEALRFRQTRIYQQGVSEVQLPPRPEGVQIAAPVPVPLGGDRWGLVWAEARAPEGVGERWPSQLYTQLWFSERRTDGWSEPRLLLHSVAPIRSMGARSIKYVPNRGTYVVVRDFDPASGPRIMFGSVAGELQGVPLPAGLAPATAVLQADEAGTMVIVADVSRGTGRDARWELIMLRSDDEGREWSDPETIWNLESPHSVDRLQFIINAAGGEHAFWGIGWPDGSYSTRLALEVRWILAVHYDPSARRCPRRLGRRRQSVPAAHYDTDRNRSP